MEWRSRSTISVYRWIRSMACSCRSCNMDSRPWPIRLLCLSKSNARLLTLSIPYVINLPLLTSLRGTYGACTSKSRYKIDYFSDYAGYYFYSTYFWNSISKSLENLTTSIAMKGAKKSNISVSLLLEGSFCCRITDYSLSQALLAAWSRKRFKLVSIY